MTQLLRVTEVMAQLNVSKSQAYTLMREEMPAVYLGRSVRVDQVDLDEWIAAKKQREREEAQAKRRRRWRR